MAEILPIRRKTLSNQSINLAINQYLGVSKLLRYKRDFVICNFAVSVKFTKKKIECFPGIPKHFVISVISL